MTQAQYSTRTIKANGIAAQGGLVRLAAGQGYVAVDVVAGSGLGHIVSQERCDCADFQFRRLPCKHMQALGVKVCATCGARSEYRVFYVGGRGDTGFMCCSAARTHKATRVE